jgi:hypothetical protein
MTRESVRLTLTQNPLITMWRSLRLNRTGRDAEIRILVHAEIARSDRQRACIEAWAEIQTESVMREILRTGMPWAAYRMERSAA